MIRRVRVATTVVAATMAVGCAAVPSPSSASSTRPDNPRRAGVHLSALPAPRSDCTVFPSTNVWNTRIDSVPVHPQSAAFVSSMGVSGHLHPDFGSGLIDGAPFGIPITTVTGTQPKVPVTFDYADESDPGPYPVPHTARIEGGSSSTGDRHVIVEDTSNCVLYELYDAHPHSNGSWTAGSGAKFNLRSNALRPAGWTSADAAGLPILAGLVRYDEVAAGRIDHAIRITVQHSRNTYLWPARHKASSLTSASLPPMGLRLRLKSTVDISHFPAQARVVAQALKTYGAIVADNGSNWYISGTQDSRWDNSALNALKSLIGNQFEAVDEAGLMVDPNSGLAH
jgi:hypothetical protein